MSRAPWYLALACCVLAACDDGRLRAFEPRASALGGGGRYLEPTPEEAGAGGGGATPLPPVAGAGNLPPTSPLLVDDFEDGDTRAQESLGWWYPFNDGTGTQGFGIEPVSGGTGSVYALRTHGSGFETWGAAVGVDLSRESTPLSAPSYEELCFAARVESSVGNSISVHLLGDEATHFRREVSLSESWSRYCLPLGEFMGENGALLPSDLIALQFFFPPGSPFVLWLDDVSFVP